MSLLLLFQSGGAIPVTPTAITTCDAIDFVDLALSITFPDLSLALAFSDTIPDVAFTDTDPSLHFQV